ncbi:hypothetical protein [Hyalangium versicolor]|uniref:hypothetical protein n=1 Tax=Hyalangium versicolor TaxID=2861190 RepID=UPI001CCFB0F8|nr:hypothetical protein [Hyalangium versicolor]
MSGYPSGDPDRQSKRNAHANGAHPMAVLSATRTYNMACEITLPVGKTPFTLKNADSAGKGTHPGFEVNFLPVLSSNGPDYRNRRMRCEADTPWGLSASLTPLLAQGRHRAVL